MKRQELSQKEIAERLGISSATVSLVLRDPETNRASAKTKERIFEFAPPRRSRKPSGRADTFLFVMSDDDKRFYYQQSMLQGAQEQAAQLGMKLEVVNPQQDLQSLSGARYIKGVLLETPHLLDEPAGELRRTFRTVSLNVYYQGELEGIGILGDPFGGFRKAIRHLQDHGHQRIGFLGYDDVPGKVDRRNRERITTFAEVCRAMDVDLGPDALQSIPTTAREKIDRSREIGEVLSAWRDSPTAPTAILCHNDLLAARLTMVALEMGIRIPEDVSLIGYDNEALCDMLSPQLTSICPNFAKMGRIAVSTLDNETLWDEEGTPYRLIVPARLQVRKSVAPPVRDLAVAGP